MLLQLFAKNCPKLLPSFPCHKDGFFRKPTSPPLPLREGPPLISVFSPQGRRGNRPTRCSNRFAIRLADHQRFFLKSTRPSLPLKKAPPLSPSPFPLRVQGMYQPPYSVLKPLRYMVGGPSEVYASSGAAVFCAGMNPPC